MRTKLLLILGMSFCFYTFIFAETIILKSGKSVEGKLIEKTDTYIKIDFHGVQLTYFFDEISSINDKPTKTTQNIFPSSATSVQAIRTEQKNYYSDKNGNFRIIPPERFSEIDITQQGAVKFTNPENPLSFFMITCWPDPNGQIQALRDENARNEFGKSIARSMVRHPTRFVSCREREINGIMALEFTLATEPSNGRFVVKNIFFNKNKKQFGIMFTAKEDSFNSMQIYFEESIATLEAF